MRLLVTGGTGFLGSAFVHAASAAGHEVAVLSRRGPAANVVAARWIAGSLQAPDWGAISDWGPEACVHAAWIATPGVYLDSPENRAWFQWSYDFLIRLAILGVRHITALGTCIEYAMTGRPCEEGVTPTNPASPYAQAKHDLHQALTPCFRREGVGFSWARVFYPYGVGEHPARLPSSTIRRLRAGEVVRIKTPSSVKDYIHVDDVASALVRIAETRPAGPVNVGTGSKTRISEIASALAQIIGRTELVEFGPANELDPLDFVVADVARLRGLGWEPKVELEQGLRRLVHAICA